MSKNEADNWRSFLELLVEFKGVKELNDFFELFLTADERKDLAKRVLLVRALLEDKLTQREIAESFNISISKITRGSNAMKTANHELKEHLRQKLL